MTAGVDPYRLIAALEEEDFEVVGRRAGAHARLAWPRGGQRRTSLIIPLDSSAPEYEEMLGAVLQELAGAARLGENVRRAVSFTASDQEPSREDPAHERWEKRHEAWERETFARQLRDPEFRRCLRDAGHESAMPVVAVGPDVSWPQARALAPNARGPVLLARQCGVAPHGWQLRYLPDAEFVSLPEEFLDENAEVMRRLACHDEGEA